MSGFVPRRVAMTRTAMGSTDANSTGKNGHSTISTIGRRSTLLRNIQTRAFGSMWQIDYLNAAGNNCKREDLVPTVNAHDTLQLSRDVSYNLTIFSDNNTRGFVRKSLQRELVAAYGGGVYVDNKCAFGSLSGFVENIKMPNDYPPASPYVTVNGSKILAIEQWFNGGWTIMTGEENVLAIAIEGSHSNSPPMTINGVRYMAEDVYTPTDFGGLTKYGSGGTIPFTLVRYGGSSALDSANPDTEFSSGMSPGKEKIITIGFETS